MYASLRISRSRAARLGAVALFHAAALSALAAHAECKNVNGHLAEQSLTSAPCTSPVGVCTEGNYSGSLRGSFVTVVSTFVPTADTPLTAAALFTADSTLQARMGKREGTLYIKNAGALRTAGLGEILDLQTIVGGTGGFAGASGVLQAVGRYTFADGGSSEITGTVCVP